MISILIPWRDGGDHIRERNFRWLLQRYGALLPEAELCVSDSADDRTFSRSQARNRAFEKSSGDVLLIADADTVFHRSQIEDSVAALSSHPWVIPYTWYYNLTYDRSREVLARNPTEDVRDPLRGEWDHRVESWAGLLVIPRIAFEQVGGYDERFVGWGYEDNAFRLALDALWGSFGRLTTWSCQHLWHPVSTTGGFNSPTIGHNASLYNEYVRAKTSPSKMRKVIGL